MTAKSFYANKKLLIAGKHLKEKVIAPVLESELGVKCFTNSDSDTDNFGTFSGEIERREDPLTTVRNKCLSAMNFCNADLAVASEGSFGPHPTWFFVPANEEFLIFIDRINKIESWVREISLDTNFNGAYLSSENELKKFMAKAHFPSHGLILRKSKEDFTDLIKGIVDEKELWKQFKKFKDNFGGVYVETDMRALFNPSRMKVIENATVKLASQINRCCPDCSTPCYAIKTVNRGLPCEYCGNPTKAVKSLLYSCHKCAFTEEVFFPDGRETMEALYCDVCNP